jgi:hypothetical protein
MADVMQLDYGTVDPFRGRKEGMNALSTAAQINDQYRRTDLMANEDARRQQVRDEEQQLAPVKRIQAVSGVMSQFLPRMSQDQYSGWRQESIKRGIPEAMLPTEETVKNMTPQEWETKKNEWAMAGEGFQRMKTAEALAKIQVDTHRQTSEMDTKNKEAQYARENNLIGRREQAELNVIGARERYHKGLYEDGGAKDKEPAKVREQVYKTWEKLTKDQNTLETSLPMSGKEAHDASLSRIQTQIAQAADAYVAAGGQPEVVGLPNGYRPKSQQTSVGIDLTNVENFIPKPKPGGTVTTAGPGATTSGSALSPPPPEDNYGVAGELDPSKMRPETRNFLMRKAELERDARRQEQERQWTPQNALMRAGS